MLETKSRSLGLCQKTILPLGPNSPLFDQLKVVIPPFLTKLTQTDSFHIFFAFFKRIHDRKLESRMKLNLKKLVGSADVGAAAADAVDGGDDVGALEAGLAHVDEGVQLTERVVVASQVEALGVVGLDSRVVAVEVLQLELGVQDGLGGLLALGDGGDDGLGDVDHDASLDQEGFQLGDGLQLGLAGGGSLNPLLKDGPGNLGIGWNSFNSCHCQFSYHS